MRGLLVLKLVEAKDLEVKDIVSGSSDPYFVLSMGEQKGISQVVPKTTQPYYDETYNFILDDTHHILKIDGYDKDVVGKDEHLGHCIVDFKDIAPFERKFHWYPLKDCKSGEVRLFTWFISLEASDARARDAFGFTTDDKPVLPTEPLYHGDIHHPVDYKAMSGDKLPKEGVPFVLKGEVWCYRSGAKEKKKNNPDTYKTLSSMPEKATAEVVAQIDKDLERTFPGHPYFMPGAPGLPVMRRILVSFSIHSPRIGYCQGMAFVVGFLMLFLDEEDAFWTLECIVNDILVNYYDSYLGGLQVDSKLVDYYFMQYYPDLKIHLAKVDASPSINCMKWFLCVFVGIFPTAVTVRIWDSLFISGRDVLLKIYLNIIRMRFAQGMQVVHATDFYELLNTTPPSVNSPTKLFAELYKHFSHLFQIGKMRANAQRAISDSINKREEMRLRNTTHFSIKELEDLRNSFSKFAKDNCLAKEDFHKLMESRVGPNAMYFMDDMFKVFDKSGDGIVDFREFCTGLSAFTKGSLDERLEFCYSLFDMNSDGYVQPEELAMILTAQYKLMFPTEDISFVKHFVDFATITFDTNKDGKFSLEEFKEVVHKQPLIVKFLNLAAVPEGASTTAYAFKS